MVCFVGFDGFIDEIIHPVASREKNSFTLFPSIQSFSDRLNLASHQSCNIELIVQEKKIGGNGPILANALLNLEHPVILAGMFGETSLDPIFEPLQKRASQLISLGNPGFSDALEFSDGKIILGKLKALQELSYLTVIEKIGSHHLFNILQESTLFVSANWTMLPMMNDLWRYIFENIAPQLSIKKRHLFVDLADPAKRTDKDLMDALELLQLLNQKFEVTLGLNKSESNRIMSLLKKNEETNIEEQALSLQKTLKLCRIVIHSPKKACAAENGNLASTSTFFTPNPRIKTGAGDNFNAGFCEGLLKEASLEQALLLGNGTAGFYVRNGKSPTLEELAIFCSTWDKIKE